MFVCSCAISIKFYDADTNLPFIKARTLILDCNQQQVLNGLWHLHNWRPAHFGPLSTGFCLKFMRRECRSDRACSLFYCGRNLSILYTQVGSCGSKQAFENAINRVLIEFSLLMSAFDSFQFTSFVSFKIFIVLVRKRG